MNSMLEACKRLSDTIEGSLLCGVVDVATGDVLALHSTNGDPSRFERAFAYSVRELLHSPSGELLDDDASARTERVTEAQLTSAHSCHLAKSFGNGSHMLVLVTRKDINVGLSWAEVKTTALSLHTPHDTAGET